MIRLYWMVSLDNFRATLADFRPHLFYNEKNVILFRHAATRIKLEKAISPKFLPFHFQALGH